MSASLRPTRHLALLRAVNLGGRNKVPMADLRALAEELGYQDVATHIASGNLFFSSPKGRDALERELTPALADRFDFAIDVVIVGRDTVAKAAEAHPFADGDPKIVHVCFCDRRVPKATLDRLLALAGPGNGWPPRATCCTWTTDPAASTGPRWAADWRPSSSPASAPRATSRPSAPCLP